MSLLSTPLHRVAEQVQKVEDGLALFNDVRMKAIGGLEQSCKKANSMNIPILSEDTAENFYEVCQLKGDALLDTSSDLQKAMVYAKDAARHSGITCDPLPETYLPGINEATQLVQTLMVNVCAWTAFKILHSKSASRLLPDAAARAFLGYTSLNHDS